MNTAPPPFSPERSTVIRDELVQAVRATTRGSLSRSHRRLAAVALVIAGMLAGGAVSAGAFAVALNPEADAPADVLPGAPVVTELGRVTSVEVSGSRDIRLVDVPQDATHVRVTVTCLTEGVTTWGLDAAGNNPSSVCTPEDVASDANSSWYDFSLSGGGDTLYIDAGVGTARVSLQYLDSVATAWGVNAFGETFGVTKDTFGEPDLVAVDGQDTDGQQVQGYARSSDLLAFGPDWPEQPTSPEQAIEWQEQRDAKYPQGWDIPVYESDGVTQIGTFHVG